MPGHIDFAHSETTNLNSIHEGLFGVSGATKALLQKVESSLQTSLAKVTYRKDDCTLYMVQFGSEDMEYPAVLAFEKKFYTWTGMPKLGDTVVVLHNNGNFAHILFIANNKDISDPPNFGTSTLFKKSISSSKCMG